ncbi:MAG: hypothetical protein N2663_06930 [Chlorobi bacterium]|nr:hypothetical protein [Chlorobiota bacterium]
MGIEPAMRAIRPFLSVALLAVLLIASDGIPISIHWCCGTLESLAVFTTADDCCCESGAIDASDDGDWSQASDTDNYNSSADNSCCRSTTAYLLMPVGSGRLDTTSPVAMMPVALAAVVGLVSLERSSATSAVGNNEHYFPSRSSPPILQCFRL